MKDMDKCDGCDWKGGRDDMYCQECQRQAKIRKGHARDQREEGGYDERD